MRPVAVVRQRHDNAGGEPLAGQQGAQQIETTSVGEALHGQVSWSPRRGCMHHNVPRGRRADPGLFPFGKADSAA
jgi:hypothetical protein